MEITTQDFGTSLYLLNGKISFNLSSSKAPFTWRFSYYKGNCDAELVLQAMIDYKKYKKAIIVSGDGDFACLVRHLKKQAKLEKVLVPNIAKYSALLKKAAANEHLDCLNNLKAKLSYKKNTP